MKIGMMAATRVMNPKIEWHGSPQFMKIEVEVVDVDVERKQIAIKAKPKFRKISRKRFERIMMALGISARSARKIADESLRCNLEYKEALKVLMFALNEEDEPEEEETPEEPGE